MKNITHKLPLLLIAIFLFSVSYAQDPTVLVIESQLTNIEGELVQNTNIDVSLLVLNSSGQLSYEKDKTIATDELGVLSLFIEDVPALFVNGSGSDPVVIQLSITSPEEDSWLEEDKFVVKYLMTMKGDEANSEYALTRMEGQKLNYEYQSDIWSFQDIYPFAYIKSTFLFSFNADIADAKSLIMVAQEFFGEGGKDCMEDTDKSQVKEAPASRGIKGGYAVGGVQKK